MAKSQNICQENIECDYEKYKNFGNKVYQEYEELYKQMWSKLNASLLEPFAKTLMEQENIVLKGQDELVQTIRNSLEHQMQQALDNFWHSNNVSEALISLEMCKEKFEPHKGHSWNMDAKTPLERTRPIRMRFKENRLRFLEAQLNSQNKQLEEVLQENTVLRHHLQDVKNQRTSLLDIIGNFRKKFELTKVEIMELQKKLVPENDENAEPNIEHENNAIHQ